MSDADAEAPHRPGDLPVLAARDLRSRSPARRRRSRSAEGGSAQLLSFSPSDELSFAVEPSGEGESTLVIVNPASSGSIVAFKIKTTSPSRYCVKPPTQILHIGESVVVKVSLLRNEATEALLQGRIIANDDRFLIQSAPVDEADMSTQSNPVALKELWTTTKWKKKTRNKLITVRFFVKTEVSDDSDDDSDSDSTSDSDAGAAPARVGDRAAHARNRDVVSATVSGHSNSRAGRVGGVADRSRSASLMSKQALGRIGAEALSRQGQRPVSSASALGTVASTSELSLSIASMAPAGGVAASPLGSSGDGSGMALPPGIMALSDRGIHFPWRQGELLGRGTSGHVYKAMRTDNGEMIAMKVLEVASVRAQADIMKEVEVLQKLNHPHVVKYLGCECENASAKTPIALVRIFMEYVSGGSLSKIVRGFGALDEPLLRRYTRQITDGLAHVHAHGYAHRDIKGANILVTDRGEVKLADFGSCKVLPLEMTPTPRGPGTLTWVSGSSTAASSPREQGTPQWMAPEVVKGKVSNRGWQQADIWSLGCTVIEMATGQPPWPDASNPATIMIRIASSDPSVHIPANLSRNAKDFMRQCLQRDPVLRPTAAKLLEHAFLKGDDDSGGSSGTASAIPASVLASDLGTSAKGSPRTRPVSGNMIRRAAAEEAGVTGDSNSPIVVPTEHLTLTKDGSDFSARSPRGSYKARRNSKPSTLRPLENPPALAGSLSLPVLGQRPISANSATSNEVSALGALSDLSRRGFSPIELPSAALDAGPSTKSASSVTSSRSSVDSIALHDARSPASLDHLSSEPGAAAVKPAAEHAAPKQPPQPTLLELLSSKDQLVSTIDKARAELHSVIANVDEVGWGVYNIWGVSGQEGDTGRDTAADLGTLTSSLASHDTGADSHSVSKPSDAAAAGGGGVQSVVMDSPPPPDSEHASPHREGAYDSVGWSYDDTTGYQWEGHDVSYEGGEHSYDADAWNAHGEYDYTGWEGWNHVDESGEWWEGVDASTGTWANQVVGGQIQRLVATEECRDTTHMSPTEKQESLHKFEGALFRLVRAWPEPTPSKVPSPKPRPAAGKPSPTVHPTLLSNGLALHWLAAARWSLQQKAAAMAVVDLEDEEEARGPEAEADTASSTAASDWYSLGSTELAPAVAIHAMSEHIAKVRCQATETNYAYSGLRLLVSSCATEPSLSTPTTPTIIAPLHPRFHEVMEAVARRGEQLSQVAGQLVQAKLSHDQSYDGWSGQWSQESFHLPAVPHPPAVEAPPLPLDPTRTSPAVVDWRAGGPSSAELTEGFGPIAGGMVSAPNAAGLHSLKPLATHAFGPRRSISRAAIQSMAEAAIPENDVGTAELPRLGLETDRLRKRLERDRIMQEYDSAARIAADSTLAAADNRQLVVLALARYTASGPNELSLDDGDTIRVLRQDPSGWWEGECRNKVGWFPSNFTKVKYDLYTVAEVDSPRSGWSMSQYSSLTGASRRSGATASTMNGGRWVTRGDGSEADPSGGDGALSSVSSSRGGPAPVVPLVRRA